MSEGAADEAVETNTDPDQEAGEQRRERASVAAGSRPDGQGGYVLDASALLCLMNDELGADRVAAVLPRAVISTVNLAEVATKLNDLGAGAEEARALLAPLHLVVIPLDEGGAFAAGALRAVTRGHGLSLGDRACLALATAQGAVALTTDKAWATLGERIGVEVEMLR